MCLELRREFLLGNKYCDISIGSALMSMRLDEIIKGIGIDKVTLVL